MRVLPVSEEEAIPRRRRWPFSWLGLLALGWVVFELTAQPALGVSLVCVKFGWEDFRTAIWLARRDPDLRRGRSTASLYAAWGLWKTAGVAFAMTLAIALFMVPNNPPGDLLSAFLSTFATTLIGFALSSLLTLRAVILAWNGQRAFWLDRAVHSACRENDWPPAWYCEGRVNRFGNLVITSLAVWVCAGLFVVAVFQDDGVVFFVASVVCPIGLALLREWICERLEARTPQECWDDSQACQPADDRVH